jgi:HPt (histidine-containing phosphotransfer) domain-containing protein
LEKPNLDYINALSGGDNAFKARLIKVIKDEFPNETAQYFQHLKIENYTKAAADVHKLKHKISILGLEKSYELAFEHEEALLNKDVSLASQFKEILTFIEQCLTNL